MTIHGIRLVSDFDGIDLPINAEVRQPGDGAWPEVEIEGVAYLMADNGDLLRRVVNNGRHVAIDRGDVVSRPYPKPAPKPKGKAKNNDHPAR